MPNSIAETLRTHRTSGDAYQRGYQDGEAAGYARAVRELEAALGAKTTAETPTTTTTPPEPPPSNRLPPDAKALPARKKDDLVISYLRAHPNRRYKDIARDLTRYVATRVYALVERGVVSKHPDGSFTLTNEANNDGLH